MAIIFPEITIKNTLERLLDYFASDLKNNIDAHTESQAYVYDWLYGVSFDGLNYYDTIKTMLLNRLKKNEQRQLKIFMGYAEKPITPPAINIIVAGEVNDPKRVGISTRTMTDMAGQFAYINFNAYKSTYVLLITSDNQNEVIVFYHFIKTMILAGYHQFALNNIPGEGALQNMSISGSDFMMENMPQKPPPHYYFKEIRLDFFYENEVKRMEREIKGTEITGVGTVIENDGELIG